MRDNADVASAIELHADTVLRVCSLYFRNRPEREDAFQETFLKYAQSDKRFEDDEHVKAWLIRVAANTCKDMLRRSEAKTVLLDKIDDAAQPGWGNGATENDPAAYGTGNERADELNEALQQLDDKYRIALYLKYYEGYTAAEIAEVLNIPENTVYTNLSRGRAKLKEVLTHGEH